MSDLERMIDEALGQEESELLRRIGGEPNLTEPFGKPNRKLDQQNRYCHSLPMTQAAKRAIDTIEALGPAERQEVLAELLRRAAQSDHDLPTDDDLIGLADQVFLDLDKHEAGQ